MDSGKLNEKKRKAQGWFRKKYPFLSGEEIEDFGSYCAEVWLSGGDKRDLAFIAIDYLRKHRDSAGKRGNSDAMGRLIRRKESDSETEDSIEQHPLQCRKPDESSLFRYRGIDSRLRVVLVLMYEWGFSEFEIGYCLGVSESRVSQMHHKALQVQKKILEDEMLSEAQREAFGVLQETVSGGLQERSRSGRQGSIEMGKISTEEASTKPGLGCGSEEEIQAEILPGTFGISTW